MGCWKVKRKKERKKERIIVSSFGRLGNGSENDSFFPIELNVEAIKACSLGTFHSGCVLKDNSLYLWVRKQTKKSWNLYFKGICKRDW